MQNIKKLLLVMISGLVLSACVHAGEGAWQGTGTTEQAGPTAVPAPTETLEEIDESVSTDLQTELDADFKTIDDDLKQLDEELKGY